MSLTWVLYKTQLFAFSNGLNGNILTIYLMLHSLVNHVDKYYNIKILVSTQYVCALLCTMHDICFMCSFRYFRRYHFGWYFACVCIPTWSMELLELPSPPPSQQAVQTEETGKWNDNGKLKNSNFIQLVFCWYI